MSKTERIIDIDAVETDADDTPAVKVAPDEEAVKLEPGDPLANAIGELLNASSKLLTAVLEKGDIGAARKEVNEKAIDAALEIVKRKGTDDGRTD